jgi:phospholipid/cholesterol/gamma-HCH transport system permease protein
MLAAITSLRNAMVHMSSVVWLLLDTGVEMGDYLLRGRLPFRVRLFFEQTDRAGVGSLPLVAMVSFLLGLTMALLTGYQLEYFGQERLVPRLIAISFSRELGPLITGIMVAARIGAAYTAELGTMTVAEEVEAIEAMGIGPLRFLVAPRVLAIFLLMPCLSVVSNIAANAGAAAISALQLGIPLAIYWESAVLNLYVRDIITGGIKSLLFGLIIGLVSCYKGLSVSGGAAGVGNATTSSVVTAVTTVIAFDTVINVILIGIQE